MDPRTTTALLYLDGVTVSFDGFRALNNLSLAVEPGEMRAIIGPNGAGKTTMMDVVTGKTRPDERRRLVRRRARSHQARRDRRSPSSASAASSRSRPCSRCTRSRTTSCSRSRATGARAPRCSGARAPRSASRIDSILEIIRLAAGARPRRRQPVARAEAVARDRHAAGAGAEAPAGRRAGRRHDRRRDAADRRAAQGDQPRPHRGRGRARHDLRARARRQGDRACTKARCWRKARSTRSRRTSA